MSRMLALSALDLDALLEALGTGRLPNGPAVPSAQWPEVGARLADFAARGALQGNGEAHRLLHWVMTSQFAEVKLRREAAFLAVLALAPVEKTFFGEMAQALYRREEHLSLARLLRARGAGVPHWDWVLTWVASGRWAEEQCRPVLLAILVRADQEREEGIWGRAVDLAYRRAPEALRLAAGAVGASRFPELLCSYWDVRGEIGAVEMLEEVTLEARQAVDAVTYARLLASESYLIRERMLRLLGSPAAKGSTIQEKEGRWS